MARWEFYLDANKVWRWRWTGDGGAVVQVSEGWRADGYANTASRNRRLLQGQIAPERVSSPVTPGSGMVRVIGTDFGSSPIPPLSWFEKARASYEGCWVPTGSWSPTSGAFWHKCLEVLDLYQRAGFRYYLTYHRPNRQVLEAWNALGSWKQKISAFCFDVEDKADPLAIPPVTAVRDAMTRDGVDPEKRLWLYSAKYLWIEVQGQDDQRFAPLFNHIAPYDGIKAGWPETMPAVNLWGGFTQAEVDGLQLRGAEPSNYQYLDGIAHHDSIFKRETLLAVG